MLGQENLTSVPKIKPLDTTLLKGEKISFLRKGDIIYICKPPLVHSDSTSIFRVHKEAKPQKQPEAGGFYIVTDHHYSLADLRTITDVELLKINPPIIVNGQIKIDGRDPNLDFSILKKIGLSMTGSYRILSLEDLKNKVAVKINYQRTF